MGLNDYLKNYDLRLNEWVKGLTDLSAELVKQEKVFDKCVKQGFFYSSLMLPYFISDSSLFASMSVIGFGLSVVNLYRLLRTEDKINAIQRYVNQ